MMQLWCLEPNVNIVQLADIVIWMLIEHPNPDFSLLPANLRPYRNYIEGEVCYLAFSGENVFSNNRHLELLAGKNRLSAFYKTSLTADISLRKDASKASQTSEISPVLTQQLSAVCDQIKLSIYETTCDG